MDDDSKSKTDLYTIGIDFGTRYSCVSIWRNKRLEVIPDQFGNRTIPSIVSFYGSVITVGHNALAMKEALPTNTIYDIKRIIGRRFNDPSIVLTQQLVSYEIASDESQHDNVIVKLDDSEKYLRKNIYTPEEICGFILKEISKMAEKYLGTKLFKAIITVPAYFNDSQRQATMDAAKIAGLDLIKIINEPTSAALAYGLGGKIWTKKILSKSVKKKLNGLSDSLQNGGNILIYDWGAGTLDVCLINIYNGTFSPLAKGGNTHLGGEDVDLQIMNHILLDFRKQNKIKINDFKLNLITQIKLKNAVENAKKILSVTDKAIVCVDDFYGGKKLYYPITRQLFDAVCNNLFVMAMKPIDDVLESAKIDKKLIDEIILVGGSTRIVKIQNLIKEYFKPREINLNCTMNPDEVVSAGAAIYGYLITHNDDPFSKNIVLLDITPLSLGVETHEKNMTVILPRNTTIPITRTKTFSTDSDFQKSVAIKIFEGERKLTRHNYHLGTFELSGFKKAPRGHAIIKISFHIDINGILEVTAHEKRSDAQNSIKITSTWGAKGRLSKEQIADMIKDSEQYEELDSIASIKISLFHKLKSRAEAILINVKDKNFNLAAIDRKKIKSDIKRILKYLNETEFDKLKIEDLESEARRVKKLYTPLIAHSAKDKEEFKSMTNESKAADVHGDDEAKDTNISINYESANLFFDSTDVEKDEINALKNTITDLCKNITNIINNPNSNLSAEDVDHIMNYIDTVYLWIFGTSSTTTIEFVSKINEINKTIDEIMQKYDDRPLFVADEKFTIKEELEMTCQTINTSLKNNFFNLGQNNTQELEKTINSTMIWLMDHQSEPIEEYKKRLAEVNEKCNSLYQNTHKFKALEKENIIVDSDSDSDDEPQVRKRDKTRW